MSVLGPELFVEYGPPSAVTVREFRCRIHRGENGGQPGIRMFRVFVGQAVAGFASTQPWIDLQITQFFQPIEPVYHGPVFKGFG